MTPPATERHFPFISPRWSYHFRWVVLSIAVGVVSGLGAIVFDELLLYILRHTVTFLTGYLEPARGAPAAQVLGFVSPYNYLIILIPTVGGLISGLIVYTLAPETAGDGTDAMIEAFHQKGGYSRPRAPFIKIITSAITIGSGGSAGKEGPISQIGAGFGSFLASALKLRPRERRILVLAGAAAGVGAIFRAPLGAALFAPEVLYRETEFEFEAILPCVVSSIVAYSIFSQVYGRVPIFFPGPVDFALPKELLPYAIFGVLCAAVGYVWIETFHGMTHRFFEKLNLPRIFKPALGGLMCGLILFFYPHVMDGGYGWVQMALEGKMLWYTMFLLAAMKIVATSCTLGSGGSGGVFGPSIFIGAMLGGGFGYLGHQLAPGWVIYPYSFVLVGMGGFFAGVSKTPLAAIIMACEMSASYTLLVPLMLVSAIAFLLLGRTGLYEKQVFTRLASPAHVREFARGLLEDMYVRDALQPRGVTTIPENMRFGDLVQAVTKSLNIYFPVIDARGEMTGILSINDIRELMFEEGVSQLILAKDVATPNVLRVFLNDSLQEALDKMNSIQVDELPVVQPDAPNDIVGLLAKRDIISYYYSRTGL
ncbi:MAG: chloride channel protein [Syntrophobacterales bacterium]|nr:chloride channel protein [Syntrophobacterales bacterium]